MRDYKRLYLSCLVCLLTACTTLGLSQPKTFNQRLAYAYGLNTTARLVAADLLDKGSISTADAINVQAKADSTRKMLDVARLASSAGDLTTAESKLTAAEKILTALQDYLNSKGGSV